MTAAGSEIPPGSVVITPQDMWDSVKNIETVVTEIRSTLAPQVADLRADHEELRRAVETQRVEAEKQLEDVKKDHEARLRVVERANWKLAGIFAALSVASGAVELWYYTSHH